jgi:hypothetical protein
MKIIYTVLLSLGIICNIGWGIRTLDLHWPSQKENEAFVVENLPFGIERDNPIPEVKHWDLEKRTYYYFNWGLKTTGGYSLALMSAKNNCLQIKAQRPRKDQMLIQALTFPSLLVSLPQGRYRYKVINETGKPIKDIFTPKSPPLKMTIYLPKSDGRVGKREILREASNYSETRIPVLMVLESLFNQNEMMDYVSRGILPQKVFFSKPKQQWYIQLSKAYENLNTEEKSLLHELISKTVLAFTANPLATVTIVTESITVSPLNG